MLSYDAMVRISVSARTGADSEEAFHTGLLLAEKDGASGAERLRLFSSAADLLSAGFTAADPAYRAALKYFAADPSPSRLYVSLFPPQESPGEAFDAVLERTDAFYGVCLCDADPAKILALSETVRERDRRCVLFYPAFGTPAEAAAADGVLARIRATGSSRSLGVYAASASDAAAVMGTAMGLALNRRDAAFALCYKRISGMQPVGLTESEAAAIKDLRGNVYVTRGYARNLLENGTVASGRRYDEVMYLDRIAADLQEAAVSLLADGSGRLPQTDETSAVFINRFTAVLAGYTAMGVLATGAWRGAPAGSIRPGDVLENGYALWADSYEIQSDADRAARRAMPVHIALCMAGAVETLLVEVDVTA